MELKFEKVLENQPPSILLIVPYGIEIILVETELSSREGF